MKRNFYPSKIIKYIILAISILVIFSGCSHTQPEINRTSEAIALGSLAGVILSVATRTNPLIGAGIGTMIGYSEGESVNRQIRYASKKNKSLDVRISRLQHLNKRLQQSIEENKRDLKYLNNIITQLEYSNNRNIAECRNIYFASINRINKINNDLDTFKQKKHSLAQLIREIKNSDYSYEEEKKITEMYELKQNYTKLIAYLKKVRHKLIRIKYKTSRCS